MSGSGWFANAWFVGAPVFGAVDVLALGACAFRLKDATHSG